MIRILFIIQLLLLLPIYSFEQNITGDCQKIYNDAYSSYKIENYSKAISACDSLKECLKRTGQETMLFKASWLQADCFHMQGNYDQELNLRKHVSEILKTKDAHGTDYALSQLKIAKCLFVSGQYAVSIPFFEESAAILKKQVNKDTAALNFIYEQSLPLAYLFMGNFVKARSTLIEGSNLIRFSSLNSKSRLDLNRSFYYYYLLIDSIGKADSILENSKKITTNLFGEKSFENALLLMEQAAFYRKIFDYEKAIRYFEKALIVLNDVKQSSDLFKIWAFLPMAEIQIRTTNYLQADTTLQRCLNILNQTKERNYYYYKFKQQVFFHLGYLYSLRDFQKHDFKEADSYYNKGLQIAQEQPELTPDIFIVNDLAQFYFLKGDLDKAEMYFQILEQLTSEIPNPSRTAFLYVLAHFHSGTMQNARKSILEWEDVIKATNDQILNKVMTLSEEDLDGYLDEMNTDKNKYYSSLFNISNWFDCNKEIKIFEHETLLKSLNLKAIQKSRELATNSTVRDAVDSVRKIEQIIARLSEDQAASFNEVKGKLEKRIKAYLNLDTFSNSEDGLFQKVRKKLKSNEALIDWFVYTPYNRDWSDSQYFYISLVKNSFLRPKIFRIFERSQLDKFFKSDSFRLFFNSLIPELSDVNTLYIIPSQEMHYFTFGNLVLDERFLNERFQIHYFLNPLDICPAERIDFQKNRSLDMFFFGGVDYDRQALEKKSANRLNVDSAIEKRRSVFSTWEYLPGTELEGDKIEPLAKSIGIRFNFFSKEYATTQKVASLSGNPKPFLLHIATHGFYFPPPEQELNIRHEDDRRSFIKNSTNPLFRTGLIMAGANKFWKGVPLRSNVQDDGILTAHEFSTLDLLNCKLVVLSACQTGMGDIKSAEGVLGLQRGLKIAGVKNIIVSLWNIPDQQTAELFQSFYNNLFSGKTISSSLSDAQKEMSQKYPPYYWAAFKLLE